MAHEIVAEGWYEDPFAIHEYRWFSGGDPTGLVRDGHIEGTDPPPDGDVPGPLVPARSDADARGDGGDLRRADDAEAEGTGAFNSAEAVWDVMPEVFPLQ